ncbi:MAG: hypothetical protein ACOCWO_05480 [Candidatus Muiribacteriaceae bacterium]
MCSDDIYTEFLSNLNHKMKTAQQIIAGEGDISGDELEELKKIFHSLKGNLVALHFDKNFINEDGATIYNMLRSSPQIAKKEIKGPFRNLLNKIDREL